MTIQFNAIAITTVAANTTLTVDHDHVKVNGTYTMTLPAISTLGTSGRGTKSFKIENVSGVVTVAVASGDTIGGLSTYVLNSAGEYIIITPDKFLKNWIIQHPVSKELKSVSIASNGTTPVTIYTAPEIVNVKEFRAISKDTVAGTVTVKNGTLTIAAFSKSAVVNTESGEEADLANTTVPAGTAITIESSGGEVKGVLLVETVND